MIVAFHPELELDCIIIQRSYARSIKKLTSLDYFIQEQLKFIDSSLINILKDQAFHVVKRRCKNSIGQMFSIESALVKKALLKWFNQKFKRQLDKINLIQKLRYETKNPINLKKDKCVL